MEKWIDRYLYTLERPDVPKWDKLCVGFCPEGTYKVGDVLPSYGGFTKTVVEVHPRIKKANAYMEQKWAAYYKNKE